MIYLFPPLLLLVTGVLVILIHWRRPDFQFNWLIATGGALTALISLAGLRLLVPFGETIQFWDPDGGIVLSLVFIWDNLTWRYGLALLALLAGVMLTDVIWASEPEWLAWAVGLLVAGFGLLTIFSGNLYSLLLLFSVVDLSIMLFQFILAEEETSASRAVSGFAVRVLGSALVVWALLASHSQGQLTDQVPFSLPMVLLLVLAFFLRLGIFPGNWSLFAQGPTDRRVGIIFGLAPAAGGFILLHRLLTFPLPPREYNAVLLIMLIPALAAGLFWIAQKNELQARSAWMAGFGLLAVLAALRGMTGASVSWGLAMILSGGLLWLYFWRERWSLILPLLGLWAISSLPFSPTWDGAALYFSPVPLLLPAYLLLQAALFGAFFCKMLTPGELFENPERWVRVIYPGGLVLVTISYLAGAWLPWKGLALLQTSPWWPGLAATGVGLGLGFLLQGRREDFSPGLIDESINTLKTWLGHLFSWIYSGLGAGVGLFTSTFEGRGGVLWALLILALFVSLLATLSG